MDRFLSKEGFTVAKAAGGREALKLAHELLPDAITLDVMMPDLDGWTVLAAIKGDPELADIPVILMTILDEKTRGFATRQEVAWYCVALVARCGSSSTWAVFSTCSPLWARAKTASLPLSSRRDTHAS